MPWRLKSRSSQKTLLRTQLPGKAKEKRHASDKAIRVLKLLLLECLDLKLEKLEARHKLELGELRRKWKKGPKAGSHKSVWRVMLESSGSSATSSPEPVTGVETSGTTKKRSKMSKKMVTTLAKRVWKDPGVQPMGMPSGKTGTLGTLVFIKKLCFEVDLNRCSRWQDQ